MDTADGDPFAPHRRAVDAAIDGAMEQIQAEPDDDAAARHASWLTERLRTGANDAAALRASIFARIRDSGKLSLAKLADRVGVSKARAAEIMQAAKRKGRS